MELLTHPFAIGLYAGLAVAAAVWIQGLLKRRSIARDSQLLRQHLHTQMEINAKGNESTRKELEDLRQRNENLKITVATLKGKPGRAELRTLHLYDKAVHLMYEKAPGFASSWESILREAESELEKSETGILPLIRKAFRPSLTQGTLQDASDAESDSAQTGKQAEK
jgi:hypothetical protein